MDCFIKKVILGKGDEDTHRYFVRFGRGNYDRRFLVGFQKGSKIKIKTGFEMANDLVRFARENGVTKFSGKVFVKDKVPGREGKKKGGSFLYEISDSNIDDFKNVYFTLLDANSSEIVLKMKKSLPKPGKDADKIDDKFCTMEVSEKYWPAVKEAFFWDVPECKKASIEHELKINEIVFPQGEKDPVKIRELSKRKGTIVRKIIIEDKESSKEYPLEG